LGAKGIDPGMVGAKPSSMILVFLLDFVTRRCAMNHEIFKVMVLSFLGWEVSQMHAELGLQSLVSKPSHLDVVLNFEMLQNRAF